MCIFCFELGIGLRAGVVLGCVFGFRVGFKFALIF